MIQDKAVVEGPGSPESTGTRLAYNILEDTESNGYRGTGLFSFTPMALAHSVNRLLWGAYFSRARFKFRSSRIPHTCRGHITTRFICAIWGALGRCYRHSGHANVTLRCRKCITCQRAQPDLASYLANLDTTGFTHSSAGRRI